MPSVFLSYSRADLPIVRSIAQKLTANGVSVWRDQEKLYAGEKWPKRLGEAIAEHDFFLLAWSESAARSYYIEFEWCTALALKKRIVPCWLDDTALPPSLRAFQGTDGRYLSKAIEDILRSIRSPVADQSERTAEVLQKLGDIQDEEAGNVLAAARTVYDQKNWIVHGHVIQGENVTVTINQSDNERPKNEHPKGVLEKWQVRLGIVVALLSIAVYSFQIKDRLWPLSADSKAPMLHEPLSNLEQPFAGTIYGEGNQRLPGVQVLLPEFHLEAVTDKNGHFEFTVRARLGQQVEVVAKKDTYETMERLASLGNEHDDFTMDKTRQ